MASMLSADSVCGVEGVGGGWPELGHMAAQMGLAGVIRPLTPPGEPPPPTRPLITPDDDHPTCSRLPRTSVVLLISN